MRLYFSISSLHVLSLFIATTETGDYDKLRIGVTNEMGLVRTFDQQPMASFTVSYVLSLFLQLKWLPYLRRPITTVNSLFL